MTTPVSSFKHLAQAGIMGILKLIVGLFIYLNLNAEPMMLLFVLTTADVITGIGRAKSLGGQYISRRLLEGLKKKASYYGAIFIVAFGVKALLEAGYGDHLGIHQILGVFISGIVAGEIISNLQNLYVIYSGEDVGEFDVIKIVFKGTIAIFKKIVDRIINHK